MIQTRVPFTAAVATKCICGGCPVQAKSKCVAALKPGLAAAVKKSPLPRAEIPGVYCASGTATCTDLDPTQDCQCGTCPNFTKFKLASYKPVGHYCRDGASK